MQPFTKLGLRLEKLFTYRVYYGRKYKKVVTIHSQIEKIKERYPQLDIFLIEK